MLSSDSRTQSSIYRALVIGPGPSPCCPCQITHQHFQLWPSFFYPLLYPPPGTFLSATSPLSFYVAPFDNMKVCLLLAFLYIYVIKVVWSVFPMSPCGRPALCTLPNKLSAISHTPEVSDELAWGLTFPLLTDEVSCLPMGSEDVLCHRPVTTPFGPGSGRCLNSIQWYENGHRNSTAHM